MSAVTIEGLRKHFGDHAVLPDFNLHIEDGEFVVLLGPSGCGKTTVLRCLAGLERPSGGRIQIGTQVVEDAENRISIPTQKRELGFVFQNYALWPHMSVWENVAYPLRVRRTSREEVQRKVGDILSLVGLDGHGQRSSMELSGGQQQRVALARALVASPRVLLLDEPLSNLDAQRRHSLRRQLRNIHREVRTSTVYVTHDQIEALTMADRVLIMRNGRIEQSGTPRDVFERPANRFVADFLGYENIVAGAVVAANGRFVSVRSDIWDGELRVAAATHLAVGTRVDLAFRANSVSLHELAREAGALDNAKPMEVRDVTFLGDSQEYVLQSGPHQLTARISAKGGSGRNAIGTTQIVSILPQDIVLLEPERNIVESAVSTLERRTA